MDLGRAANIRHSSTLITAPLESLWGTDIFLKPFPYATTFLIASHSLYIQLLEQACRAKTGARRLLQFRFSMIKKRIPALTSAARAMVCI